MALMISSDRSRRRTDDEISLPEDLMMDVLMKMQGQHVFNFRCLSKYYKELIESDDFIKRHYDESIKTRPNIILHHMADRPRRIDSLVMHLDLADNCKVDQFRPPFNDEGDKQFLGCRRGILCYQAQVVENREYLIFWNPLTGAYRRSSQSVRRGFNYRFLFGYDAATDDFKVIKMSQYFTYNFSIYSLKADCWSEMQGFDHIRSDRGKRLDLRMSFHGSTVHEVFVEGTNSIHVIAKEQGKPYAKSILAFDFRSAKFNLVPLPKDCTDTNTKWDNVGLSSVDNCICFHLHEKRYLSSWILKEYGDVDSWTPLLSLKLDSISDYVNLRPLVFVVNSGRTQLMLTCSHCSEWQELYFYDIHQKQLTDTKKEYKCVGGYKGEPQHFLFVPSHRQI